MTRSSFTIELIHIVMSITISATPHVMNVEPSVNSLLGEQLFVSMNIRPHHHH